MLAAAALLPSGVLPQPDVGTAAWWAWRPVWIVLLGVATVPLVAAFARFEARRLRPRSLSTARAAVAAGMGFLARCGFAVAGMPAGLPLVPLGVLGVAWLLVSRPPARQNRTAYSQSRDGDG